MMNIRKDVQIAWNLIKNLDGSPHKTEYYLDLLNDKYKMDIKLCVFRKIVTALANSDLVKTKKNLGIMKSSKRIIHLMDIMEALGCVLLIQPVGPSIKIYDAILETLTSLYIVNNNIGD